ncbi:MAG TPA: ferritin-like domain-containing protein [Acidimicrobiales bacterium]|nr:ferritin-like domain-containing protein [Acidimicrobiales bacterium]
MASSVGFHEKEESLRPETRDRHRAWASVQEELEAIDWYDQRVDAAGDAELKGLLAHNRDEEKEHAAMVIEWLRRRDPKWDEMLRQYLFTDLPILDIEAAAERRGDAEEATSPSGLGGSGDLEVRSLRGASAL